MFQVRDSIAAQLEVGGTNDPSAAVEICGLDEADEAHAGTVE